MSGLRLTRRHLERLPARVDERGPIIVDTPDEGYYDRTADAILARLGRGEGLWVFAAGSLIWDPRMEVAERRTAKIEGWRRSFCIMDRRFRGSPSLPGLMMSLDRGGACSGVVLRMDGRADLRAALIELLQKEPTVPPEWVQAATEAGPVNAILFAVDPTWPIYCPEPALEALADTLSTSVGFIGTMAEYLLNTVTELESAGIHDPHLWKLQELVAERLEHPETRAS